MLPLVTQAWGEQQGFGRLLQGQSEEDFLIMSSNRKPHGDFGINVFSTGAESRQDVVSGREKREEKMLVGVEVVSLK